MFRPFLISDPSNQFNQIPAEFEIKRKALLAAASDQTYVSEDRPLPEGKKEIPPDPAEPWV
jgi:hypothetical protein